MIAPRTDALPRIGARVVPTLAIVVFASPMLAGDVPEDREGGTFTDDVSNPLQITLLILAAIGLVVSFRSMAVVAAMVALSGVDRTDGVLTSPRTEFVAPGGRAP